MTKQLILAVVGVLFQQTVTTATIVLITFVTVVTAITPITQILVTTDCTVTVPTAVPEGGVAPTPEVLVPHRGVTSPPTAVLGAWFQQTVTTATIAPITTVIVAAAITSITQYLVMMVCSVTVPIAVPKDGVPSTPAILVTPRGVTRSLTCVVTALKTLNVTMKMIAPTMFASVECVHIPIMTSLVMMVCTATVLTHVLEEVAQSIQVIHVTEPTHIVMKVQIPVMSAVGWLIV